MPEFSVLADMRFWPTSGLGKVETAIVSRKPNHAHLEKLDVVGKYGHPLSTARIARAIKPRVAPNTIFWSAGFVPPLYCSIPAVVTVHDLTHLHYYDHKRRLYFNTVFRFLYKHCAAIICVSEHTRHEFLNWSGIPIEKVHVVHNGFDGRYAANKRKTLFEYKYILYAGNHRPYKNITTLIRAFAESRLSECGIHLAITGTADADLASAARETDSEPFVHFLGHVPEEDMPALYRGAEVVSYISLYEGFGLPLLEAMASETPVVTSNISSMPEVAGDAALIVNPLSVSEVATALRSAALDNEVREDLIRKGLARCRRFKWDDAAAKVWTLLEEVALKSA